MQILQEQISVHASRRQLLESGLFNYFTVFFNQPVFCSAMIADFIARVRIQRLQSLVFS